MARGVYAERIQKEEEFFFSEAKVKKQRDFDDNSLSAAAPATLVIGLCLMCIGLELN